MSVFRAPDNEWINLLKVICLKDFVKWQMGGQSCLALQEDGEKDIAGWVSWGLWIRRQEDWHSFQLEPAVGAPPSLCPFRDLRLPLQRSAQENRVKGTISVAEKENDTEKVLAIALRSVHVAICT